MCVYGTLPSRWETVCSTFTGTQRDGACPTPARLSAAITVDSGRYIHIFGGSGGRVPRNDLWTYDTVTRSWSMDNPDWREEYTAWTDPVCGDPIGVDGLTVIPKPRYNPVLSVDTGGFLIVGGGVCSDYSNGYWNRTGLLKDYFMFGRDTRQWIPLSVSFNSDPPAVTNFSSVVYEHKVYIFGGVNTTGPHQQTYYNTLWVGELSPMPEIGQDGIVYGGTMADDLHTFRRVVPNPDSPLPPPRADHTAVVSGTRMYVFGGRNENEALGDMWAFDFDTGNWTEIVFGDSQAAPPPRFAHDSAVCRGAAADMSDVIIIHGGRGLTDLSDETVYGYSIGQRIWLTLSNDGFRPPKRVYGSLTCGINGELWLFGGVDENGHIINDFYRMF